MKNSSKKQLCVIPMRHTVSHTLQKVSIGKGMADCGCKLDAEQAAQRQVLRRLLAINAAMFVVENFSGLLAHSTALLADSLDMLADAVVYGVSLYAVGRAASKKARAATLSGIFQVILASFVLFDVIRRFVSDSSPEPGWMIGVGLVALIANLYCFALISKHKGEGMHMRASWIFSRNDAIANISVIVAGVLVILLSSKLPDLIIGLGISLLVLWGGITIIRESQQSDQNSLNRP